MATRYLRNVPSILRSSVRPFATVTPSTQLASVPTTSTSTSTSISTPNPYNVPAVPEPQGPLRPHLNIPINSNHGLYGFFRVKTGANSHTQPRDDGQPEYVAIEAPTGLSSGRAWNAAELRRKSFKDLHTLWYVLLRERNLLATQSEEKRKIRARPNEVSSQKAADCRKSMARIKAVINERRHAYQHAIRLRRELGRRPPVESGEGVESKKDVPKGESMFESSPPDSPLL